MKKLLKVLKKFSVYLFSPITSLAFLLSQTKVYELFKSKAFAFGLALLCALICFLLLFFLAR